MSIQYQIIERKDPHDMVLHGEEVNKTIQFHTNSPIVKSCFSKTQICDYYDWLENDSEQRNDILRVEADTLQKYLDVNSSRNDWLEIREIFHNAIDYELFSDVQLINGHIFYSYRNFSKSIYKPWVQEPFLLFTNYTKKKKTKDKIYDF